MAAPMFDLVYTVTADGNVPVTKYRSKKTGLTVFIAQVEGPLVNGYFCLATEAHDDDGLPHTLEHLVFLGSEDFPYKGTLDLLANRSLASGVHAWTDIDHTRYTISNAGSEGFLNVLPIFIDHILYPTLTGVLDLLANRCLASGTNAWTDTDHTCYTMTNAGSEGFLNLLPIYIDHILYPTLTESGYITEVHHINGEGEDAGVVYCEMQARENSGESRTHLEMLRAMYPGHCGYRSETGGIMKNLRESCSHTKVCNYHRAFYRPENLCVIITGQISPDDVFKALQPVEEKIASKGSLPEFTRPWQSAVPPLENSVPQVVKYAADDETHGLVNVAWRGPAAKDQYTYNSLNVLYEYLSDSAISPLEREFVQIEDPYCSNVDCHTIENSECCIYVRFGNVFKEKLQQIFPRLKDVLGKLGSGEEKLDMTRISNLIHRKVLDSLSAVEDNPHDIIACFLIGDFLYGDTKEDSEVRVQNVKSYTRMKSEPESYWVGLINKYFIDKPYVLIMGEPSNALMEEMAKSEEERVAKQQKLLGEAGLTEKATILDHATDENEKEAPDSMLTSVNVPDVKSIFFHPIKPTSNHRAAENQHELFPLDKIPFKFQLDDVHSSFVQISALLDSSAVPQDLKYFLPLLCEVLFESPVMRDGVLIPHEEVISQLEADTLTTAACLGTKGSKFSCGSYPQVVRVAIKVELQKYEKGVDWLRDILHSTRFTAERLRVVAKRLTGDIAGYKRKGNNVVRTLLRSLVYSKDCNHQVASMLKQNKFLEQLVKTLDTNPAQVEEKMNKVREILTRADNLCVHMSADVSKLAADGYKPQDVWSKLSVQRATANSSSSVMKRTYEYVLPVAEAEKKSVIVGVGSVESSYLVQVVSCVNSYLHEDLPAIRVFIQYLTQLEGPMWRQIRGLGLSYHYSMYVIPETGLLYFVLARSTHIASAYKEASDIVMGYVSGEQSFSDVGLESAKSSLTFEIIEEEKTVADVSEQSLLSYFMQVTHSYNKDLLKKILAVTVSDLKRVGDKYILPIFKSNQIRRAVCCNPSKVDEVVGSFKELGVELNVVPSLEEDFLSQL